MAMQGNLKDMDVATLIQHNCQDKKTARLDVQENGQAATLFFRNGAVVHATFDNLEGEEVVYQVVNWTDGTFILEIGTESPTETIQRSWSGLLLEAAKRLDESSDDWFDEDDEEEETPETDTETSFNQTNQRLTQALADFLEGASEIEGAAIVGADGLIYAANMPHKNLDENTVGAVTAAIYGLSRRSIKQLKRGNFSQTFIQGNDGNIITTGLNEETIFVGLTPQPVNLGMAFAEMREVTAELKGLL